MERPALFTGPPNGANLYIDNKLGMSTGIKDRYCPAHILGNVAIFLYKVTENGMFFKVFFYSIYIRQLFFTIFISIIQ